MTDYSKRLSDGQLFKLEETILKRADANPLMRDLARALKELVERRAQDGLS